MTSGKGGVKPRLWKVGVTEVIFKECEYVVEAETAEEARELAAIGNTVNEWPTGRESVSDRHLHDDPSPYEGEAHE